jgi:serine/threonine protein kinase
MDFLGKTLGSYRIDRLLGEGGMGAVYQAFDLTLQREVAIKLIHPHYARRSEFRERFTQEARLMARLDHPGIVKVYILGKEGDLLYLPMEFIRGGNLRQLLDKLIQQRKWLPLNEAVLLMRQLCQTVNYAHEHGVLHRDIKPDNLMLKPEPTEGLPFRVVLTDLGLAKLLQGLGMTQEGMQVGTPSYMSPEQSVGRNTDARSDVYALGILLYQLAVGRLPFPIRTTMEAVRYHTREQPPSPRSIRPDLPEALERVILKCLEKLPGSRYASAAIMADALKGIASFPATTPDQRTQPDSSLSTVYDHSLIEAAKPQSTSLMTMFDGGSLPPRGESIFVGKSIPPSSQTRIQVVYRDKTAQVFPLRSGTVTIGRGPNNDIPVSDPKVSSRHAQVSWDGMEYHVMDLGSTNGTYLDNTRLLAGIQEVWRANQSLRIGDVWLRLIRPAADASQGPGIGSGISSMRSRAGSNFYKSSGTGFISVAISPQQLSVVPGESVAATLSLLNQSPNVDHYSLSITGIPNSWITSLPTNVQLMPGEQTDVSLSLLIPRSPQSRAGQHPIVLRVSSQRDTGQFVEVKLTLAIAAYSQFKTELQPQRLRAGQPGHLSISNHGNAPESFNVQFTDAAGDLSFETSQPHLQVGPGETTLVSFHSKEKQPRWIGAEKLYPLAVKVNPAKGESQTLHADLASRGVIPIWVPAITFLLCLALVGAVTWMILQGQANQVPTDPAIPGTGADGNPTNINPGSPTTFTPWPESTTSTTPTSQSAAQTTKAITAFVFTGSTASGVINEAAHTIAVTVPSGTNVAALIPNITHTGASISPNSGVSQNFTSPVAYTVTAADGSSQTYIVTVTVAAQTTKAITAFIFNGPAVSGVINEATHTIMITVPSGTNVNSLVPNITHTGASINPSSGAVQNFTSPVIYTVTAADGSTQAYTVTVTRAASANADLSNLVFSTGGLNPVFGSGTTNYTQSVPNSVTGLTVIPIAADATANIRVNDGTVASGSTSNLIPVNVGNNTINITVIAQDGTTTRTYSVTVTRAVDYAVQVRNTQYQLSSSQVVPLVDGKFEQGTSGNVDFISVHLLDFIAVADLNANGTQEVVVLISENYGGSGTFIYLTVYENINESLSFKTSILVDDRALLHALSIQNNEILLDATIHGPDDPLCCPMVRKTLHYRYADNKLQLMG